ncbi:hypothetical protein [Albatrosspox virus]|nr:hypothetical protein [Albatrosspox virus]
MWVHRSWRPSFFLYTLCYLIPIELCLISINITLLELKSKILLLLLLRVVKRFLWCNNDKFITTGVLLGANNHDDTQNLLLRSDPKIIKPRIEIDIVVLFTIYKM